eukprot:CAMPEP_0179423252 /NCGR_PEP_ID=MMETSP0799-20121207/10899_1 /TAXON_ID=46947 /ORGANISM="Geminigera cryophila, Strain CCMP2564" /LENGTH=286 /DNA_ID=CAMNT_0021197511 /DNA_START=369 /DNA_END=1226 /DNA_ORIENTATION=+
MPPEVLQMLGKHLRMFSKQSARELYSHLDETEKKSLTLDGLPFRNAVMACDRSWSSPNVEAILQGVCQDLSHREVLMLQKARLHVLERAKRWKEAYHYSIFHGHISKSLFYVVRAGRHLDVLQMVKHQRALAHLGRCVQVCVELDTCSYDDYAWRLALYCAFHTESTDGTWIPGTQEAEVSRLPYIHWLVRQLKGKLDEGELLLRSTSTLTGSALERVRKDSLEWAQLVAASPQNLCTYLSKELPLPPHDCKYSQAFVMLERLAALSASMHPWLHTRCAKIFMYNG